MKVLEAVPVVDLPDQRVAVCGDWHGDLDWLRTVRHAAQVAAPDVTTILQLGDWSMDSDASDAVFAGSGIERVYVTLGNHEPWPEITPLLDAHPGQAIRVSKLTWLLPRPARLRIGGRDILSLGGAASVDREWRTPGVSWWPDEMITDLQVADAIAGGPADVMLTHESPARTPVDAVNQILQSTRWDSRRPRCSSPPRHGCGSRRCGMPSGPGTFSTVTCTSQGRGSPTTGDR